MNVRSLCDDIKFHNRHIRSKLDDLSRVVKTDEDKRTLQSAGTHLTAIDDVVKRAMDDYKAEEEAHR